MELISNLEALNIESLYNQASYQKLEGEGEFELARLTLEQKMNLEKPMDFDIDTDLKEKKLDIDINECLRTAFINRSEVKIAYMTADSSRFGKLAMQAKMWPKVDISGRLSKHAERYTERTDALDNTVSIGEPDPQKDWFLGFEFSWLFGGSTASYNVSKRIDLGRTINTFYGGQLYRQDEFKLGVLDNLKAYSDQKEADIAYKKALNEMNETKQKVTLEVKEAFYNYKKSLIHLSAAKSKTEFEKREAQILDLKRSMGETELSEVMNAMLRKTQSQITFFEAISNLNFSIVALNKAVGLENYFSK